MYRYCVYFINSELKDLNFCLKYKLWNEECPMFVVSSSQIYKGDIVNSIKSDLLDSKYSLIGIVLFFLLNFLTPMNIFKTMIAICMGRATNIIDRVLGSSKVWFKPKPNVRNEEVREFLY